MVLVHAVGAVAAGRVLRRVGDRRLPGGSPTVPSDGALRAGQLDGPVEVGPLNGWPIF